MRRRRRSLVAVLVAWVLTTIAAPGSALATPGPANSPEYWFDSWHVPQLWASGARGQGITIAEIDTGVNAKLPELRGRILRGTDFGQADGNGRVDREINSFGHGTAMASIMVARPGLLGITGLAPGAKVLPVAVPLNGTSERRLASRLPDAIRYAADHGAKVISMSIGGKQHRKYDTVPCPAVEQDAIFYALDKGAVVVASVGNTGPSDNTVEEPASCLGVVSVGAVDETGTVAAFSAREPYLSLVAPGVNIASLGRIPGDAFSGDGTSQAAALVSAALALAWSKDPSLTNTELVTRLLATLDDHRTTPSEEYGYGLLDAGALVTGTVPESAANPVFATAAPFRARSAALDESSTTASAQPAATSRSRATGAYAVSDTSRITARVIVGLAIAALGSFALVVLVVARLRRRRVSRAAAATLD